MAAAAWRLEHVESRFPGWRYSLESGSSRSRHRAESNARGIFLRVHRSLGQRLLAATACRAERALARPLDNVLYPSTVGRFASPLGVSVSAGFEVKAFVVSVCLHLINLGRFSPSFRLADAGYMRSGLFAVVALVMSNTCHGIPPFPLEVRRAYTPTGGSTGAEGGRR